jgi:PAS domain S-box-containing protein
MSRTTQAAEESRLAAVRSLGLVDTPPEERFDRITRLVQAYFRVPLAFMTLVERDRLFFKSHQGTPLTGLLREGSLCDEALRRDDVMVVEDASRDERYRHGSLVAGPAAMRFYAGHPVRTHDGHAVGTLCVLDTRPRTLDDAQRSQFASFARLLESELHRGQLERARSEAGTVEHELRRFFSLSLDMLCIAGHDGYFKELNPAWESTLGWSREELLGRPYLDFVHREDRARTVQEARLLEQGDITVAFENRYRCKDGSYRHLLWSAVADPAGGRVFAVARDITALRATEEALRRSRTAGEAASLSRGRLLAGLGLELRQPLERTLGIVGSLDVASARRDDDVRARLEQAGGEIRSLLATVEDLLELASFESEPLEPQRVAVDLAQLVEAVRAGAEPLASRAGCALRVESPGPVAPLHTDARRLAQALRHVVEHAILSAGRGTVVVRLLAEPGGGRPERIVVEETTGGPRAAGEPGTSSPAPGVLPLAGLQAGGAVRLPIARALCERLGHRLQVLSRAGVGSTCTIDVGGTG